MESYGKNVEVWALGTNAIATTQMLKAGANRGATGENAIRHCVHKVDAVVGPISIMIPHAFMGEVTPGMVDALGASSAVKLLLPFTQERVVVVGTIIEPLPHQVENLVERHLFPLIGGKGNPANTGSDAGTSSDAGTANEKDDGGARLGPGPGSAGGPNPLVRLRKK
jgi:hypothetical protein